MCRTKTITELFNTLPQVGQVEWMGVRPGRRQEIQTPKQVQANVEEGLLGDRYAGRSGKRQVTLIQWEHLTVIASLMAMDELNPSLLRRNIAVSGVNLLALKDKQFSLGNSVLEYTGLCHPCSFMEKTLGAGGYNAVRGHGGITARVVQSGQIKLKDPLFFPAGNL